MPLLKQRDIYTSRYYRHGKSYGIIIPPDLREQAKLLPGDIMLMNFSHGVLWCIKATQDMIISREKMTAIFDQMFKERRGENGRTETHL